jgi:hypothetical protein
MCQARQYSDTMQCARCHLQWDTNDANPPACQGEHIGATPKHFLVETLRRCANDYSTDEDHDTAGQLMEAALLIERKN